MKKKNHTVPAPSKLNLLRQIGNFIPDFLVPKLARQTGVDKKVRTCSAWSRFVARLYAPLTYRIGLNDVCNALNLHSGPLSRLRGATAPTRNNLSNSNKVRSAEMAQKLFWAVFELQGKLSPRFVSGKAGKRFTRKFKRAIHLVDSPATSASWPDRNTRICLEWGETLGLPANFPRHFSISVMQTSPKLLTPLDQKTFRLLPNTTLFPPTYPAMGYQ